MSWRLCAGGLKAKYRKCSRSLLEQYCRGQVGIAGDVIWWLDSEEQVLDIHHPDHSQAKGMNMEDLVASRKKLLAMCNYIIPGHGRRLRVDK